MSDDDRNSKIVAGVAAVVLGLAGFTYYSSQNDKDGAKAACTLSATGVTAIATGLSRGKNAQAIVAIAGPALGTAACRDLVDSLVAEPAVPVPVTVNLGEEFRSGRVTAGNFQVPTTARPRTCFDWISPTLEFKCLSGELSPPPF